jgi:eukaryotic-like serine/threonine-protein kinase
VSAVASKPVRITESVKFGEGFELDVRAYELRRDGRSLKLERIPMELLVLLAELRGQLVTREQIVERIWGNDVYLDTDNSINGAIRKIRQVLKDDSERPRFVVTVTGKGYRFIAPVEEVSPPAAPLTISEDRPSSDSLLGKKISHYRVVQMLGGGGMGIVYKAEDLKLGRPVALKLLPSELATDARAFERLQREARAASALDHPNICSIYELGEHEGQPFIVMQLLEGETLREWIERAGQLGPSGRLEQILDLAIQVTDGLEAAHQKSIIHRDVKPANIFVTRRGQAKILDFGVAKFLEGETPEHKSSGEYHLSGGEASPPANPHLTQTGLSLGTPSYLSPEQIRHEKVDARTDLFSFGLVLYEMATGQRAFSGNTATVIREALLQRPATPVRNLNPKLPPALERVIEKSLQKDRECRYQTAAALRSDLLSLRSAKHARSRWRAPWMAAVAVSFCLVLVVLIANLGGVRDRLFLRRTSLDSALSSKPRVSVAVLGFKNLSDKDDAAWISTALSEMLSAELSAGQQLRIIASEDVARVKVDLSLPAANSYGRATLTKVRTLLNSDMVVVGSYLAAGKEGGGKIRVDLELQDTRSGETVAVISENGEESRLADMVSRGGSQFRQKLGIGDVSAIQAKQVLSSVPANLEAARLYAEALAMLEKFDALAARNLLEQAIKADPNHALSHAALAQAWSALGYDAKAAKESKRALELSADLPREQRLSIEGNYREFLRDLPVAIEIYRTLNNFFPDNPDYALRLAAAQTKAGLPKEAVHTVARMRDSGTSTEDVRIDLAQATASNALGDFRGAQELALGAARKAQAQDSRLLLSEAKRVEAWTWDRLGDFDKAEKEMTVARQLAEVSGNPQLLGSVLRTLGIIHYDKGEFETARRAYAKALEVFRKAGTQSLTAATLVSLGNIDYDQGRLPAAKQYYEEALHIDREIAASPSHIGSDLGSIANVLDGMGDLLGATKMQEESLQGFRQAGDRRGESDTQINLGNVLLERGELASARENYDQAISIAQEIGYKSGRAAVLEALAEIERTEDQLQRAYEDAQQALALRQELGDAFTIAQTQLELAEVALAQSDAAGAEKLARSAAPALDGQNAADRAARCAAILSRALLAQSNTEEAKAAVERAQASAQRTADRSSHFTSALTAAQVYAAKQQFVQGSKLAEMVRAESSRYGYVGFEFEARLALGRLEIRSGNNSVGRVQLQQLQAHARKKGFILIAREAAAALKSPE